MASKRDRNDIALMAGDSIVISGSGGNDHNDGGDDAEHDQGRGASTAIAKPKTTVKTPASYRVLLLNDDFTPMEFVIHILQKFFQKEYNEATRIMLQVHGQGAGVAGVFTFEIAETKVFHVNQYAKSHQHPLKCTMEKI